MKALDQNKFLTNYLRSSSNYSKMTNSPIWITEANVVSLMSLPEAVGALEQILVLEAAEKAANLPKTHLIVGANDAMHALGASIAGENICGFKTWVNIRGKSSTIVSLFSLIDGALLAIVEATALGQMRTAAMTGVGTKWLAPKEANEMAVVGSGKQALPQVAACTAVRPLKKLRVFSRTPTSKSRFAEAVRAEFDFEVVEASSLEDAVTGVPIITLITNATEPFLKSEMVAAGAHINAMGAIVPTRIEFFEDIFPRSDIVAVDSVQSVHDLSAEFRTHYKNDQDGWASIQPISKLIANQIKRDKSCDISLFKAMGMGISDLALAVEIYKRAQKNRLCETAPERIRTPPRLQK